VKLLSFLADGFRWEPHAAADTGSEETALAGTATDCVVAFVHAEAADEADPARALRHVAKHLKWQARKGDVTHAVLHSFTHLGGDGATPAFAQDFLVRLQARLETAGFTVQRTPFGHTCAWHLDVRGESLAKVWKEC
jgi:hypothetical protein